MTEHTFGSIKVITDPSGNFEIDTTHTVSGLIRSGIGEYPNLLRVVVERADANDLVVALQRAIYADARWSYESCIEIAESWMRMAIDVRGREAP